MGFNLQFVEVPLLCHSLFSIISNSPWPLAVLPCFSSLLPFPDWMSDLQLHDPAHNTSVAFLASVSPAKSLSGCWHTAPPELRDIYEDCPTLLPDQPFFESRTSTAFYLTLMALAQFSLSSGRIFIFEKWCLCMLPELKTFSTQGRAQAVSAQVFLPCFTSASWEATRCASLFVPPSLSRWEAILGTIESDYSLIYKTL